MAIDMVQEVFPGATVTWERTPRVAKSSMTLTVSAGKTLVSKVPQIHISDDYRGKGADDLKKALEEHKATLDVV